MNEEKISVMEALTQTTEAIRDWTLDKLDIETTRVLEEAQWYTDDAIKTVDVTSHITNKTIHITAEERESWNAKSEFSGNYDDLTNKPAIPSIAGLATTTSVTNSIGVHNTSTTSHNDIRELISKLTIKLNNFLDVDDATTDQLSEVLTLINSNKGMLDSLTTNKINVSDIVDNLTTALTTKVLSANQGVVLSKMLSDLQEELEDHITNHITETERTNWNTHINSTHAPINAEKNQNAFSNIVVGTTTVAADSVTDTLTLVAGDNINITPNATNNNITIAVKDLPTTLPNPNVLTINGVSYDGSSAVNVNIDTTENATDEETVNALIDAKMHSVKTYGAKGDGSTDDTAAFKAALAAERIVYVPSGTYILGDELIIRENCCLELVQDTVLNFTQTDKNCITMLRSASIKGNHATVFVKNTFNKKVINGDTTYDEAAIDKNVTNANNIAVPPFKKWDPQWKMTRYVTDLNICKPNDAGNYNAGTDLKCYGTALFLGCFNGNTAAPAYMWGINMSGVRIAGGFTYGIHIHNDATRWNHDMRIEAVIEGCETGVLVENCNLAHLAVTVQPKAAYISGSGSNAIYKPYAKNGIKLVDSLWVDLSSSYVWDWTSDNTLVGKDPTYQHIALLGDCSGVNIYDASNANSNQFWNKIYYDNPASMFGATIHGPKGKVPIDPKYAFYKNYRSGSYEFMNQNVSWRDYNNMVRYDVPVTPQNAYSNPNRLYKIGSFTIGGTCENVIPDDPNTEANELADDKLAVETVTIEENNMYGLTGWSNLYCGGSSVVHYWNPLNGVYENRVPVYFYSKASDGTFTIYRLVTDQYDIQHVYNCRVSITNARRFIFDFKDMGSIDSLDTTNTYKRITPAMHIGTPKFKGEYALVGGKPVVCTANATWSANGAISTNATTKQLALVEDIESSVSDIIGSALDEKFETLSIKTEQTDFISQASGEYIPIEKFTNAKGAYQTGVWFDIANKVIASAAANIIYIEPMEFKSSDVIRIRGIDFSIDTSSSFMTEKSRIYRFNNSTNVYTDSYVTDSLIANSPTGEPLNSLVTGDSYSWDAATFTLTLTLGSSANDFLHAFGGTIADGYTAESVIITINEEIDYDYEWHGEPKKLDSTIYAQNVILTSPDGNTHVLEINNDGTLKNAGLSEDAINSLIDAKLSGIINAEEVSF